MHGFSPLVFLLRYMLLMFLVSVFCFVCLHPVSFVSNVASVSGLSIALWFSFIQQYNLIKIRCLLIFFFFFMVQNNKRPLGIEQHSCFMKGVYNHIQNVIRC